MKLSHDTVEMSVRMFDLLMWGQYQIEIGSPIESELNDIADYLTDIYNVKFKRVSECDIRTNVKCVGACFLSHRENWCRVPSNTIMIMGEYCKRHPIDTLNLQEYLVQNLEEHNHSDMIPLVLSELKNVEILVNEATRRFESGIHFGNSNYNNNITKINSIIGELNKKNEMDLYKSLSKGV